MFLGLLNDEERKAFTALAEKMIESDGIVVGSEIDALRALQREMGQEGATAGTTTDPAELAAVFRSRRSRVAALLELVGLGYSDADYSVDEHSLVTEIAGQMGLSNDDLVRIEQWVARHVGHVEAALALMNEQ